MEQSEHIDNRNPPSSHHQDPSKIRSFFEVHGYFTVRSALSPEAVSSFNAAIDGDLASGRHSEAPRTISLSDATSWPCKKLGTHRIVEVSPEGSTSALHWAALRGGPLAQSLDALLGEEAWRLPLNGDSDARHWYVPVTFPEARVAEHPRKDEDLEDMPPPTPSPPHVCLMAPLSSLAQLSAPLLSALTSPCSSNHAASLWQPINRRRVVGRGWHVDVGPGFPNDGVRTPKGDVRQGVVLLVLLSDWPSGGGGTVLVPGSHGWVHTKLTAEGEEGMTHARLNEWVVARMRELAEAGQIDLHSGDLPAPPLPMWAADGPAEGGRVPALQVTGKAGDVVLMHPLLVHSGTMNLASFPRILANGMAVSRHDCFEQRGCCMMRSAASAAVESCGAAFAEYESRAQLAASSDCSNVNIMQCKN